MRHPMFAVALAGAMLIGAAACSSAGTSTPESTPEQSTPAQSTLSSGSAPVPGSSGSTSGAGGTSAVSAGDSVGDMVGTDQEVTFTAGQVTIHGSLRMPAGVTDPVPAAVLLAGSGPTDRNGNTTAIAGDIGTLSSLANVLAAAGVASLRYDKLSSGATGLGPYTAATIGDIGYSDFVDEGRAALQLLARQPDIDTTRLLLVGHSEGALISLSLAAQPTADQPALAGIALLESPGSRYLDLISTQLTAALQQLVAAGKVSSDEAATVTTALPTAISALRSSGAFPPGLPTLLQQQGLSAVNAHFLAQADQADPVQLARSLPAGFEVLTSCSRQDEQVPCTEMAKLDEGLADATITPLTLTTADHFLKDEPPGTTATSVSELSFSQELPPKLTAWLKTAVG